MDDVSPARDVAPMLGRRWWVPSAFAILALLLLLVVPAIVDERVGQVRSQLDLGQHARVLLNDLEAAFASQILVQSSATPVQQTPAFATRGHLQIDEAALSRTVGEMGPQAIAQFEELSGLLEAWNASPHDGSAESARRGLDLLGAAERLDASLEGVSERQRDEARHLERYYVVAPAILTPIALIAIVIVMWSGGRVRAFARLAEEERAQVVHAAEARAALLRGVTHDVKNPLGAAAGYAQLLEEGIVGPLAASQLEMVRRIKRLVQLAVQTVADLLELARADGELHLEYAKTDLSTLVDEVVDDHGGMAREHGVTIAVAAEPTPIVTDPLRVRQILENLVSNALKYTPAGGHVRVGIIRGRPAANDGKQVGIEVRDSGPGIPRDLRGRIFEEFFRVRNGAEQNSNGNGLGLAISRRIARLLGGDVTFADAEGGGAVFTLWFPTAEDPRAADRDALQET